MVEEVTLYEANLFAVYHVFEVIYNFIIEYNLNKQ